MTLSVSINTNAQQLAKKFDKDVEQIKRFLDVAVKKASFVVERGAKIKAPVDTGRLRSSIQTDIRTLTGTIRPTVDYASFVHEGTRHMTGRPFLKDALTEGEKQIHEIFIKAVHDALQ